MGGLFILHKPPEKQVAKRSRQRPSGPLFSVIVVAHHFLFPSGCKSITSTHAGWTQNAPRVYVVVSTPEEKGCQALFLWAVTSRQGPMRLRKAHLGHPQTEPVPAFVVGPQRHHPY